MVSTVKSSEAKCVCGNVQNEESCVDKKKGVAPKAKKVRLESFHVIFEH